MRNKTVRRGAALISVAAAAAGIAACVGDSTTVVGVPEDGGSIDATTSDSPNATGDGATNGSDAGTTDGASTDGGNGGADANDGAPPPATGTPIWIDTAASTLQAFATDVAIDAAGNVVVVGIYGSVTIDLGNGKTLPTSAAAGFVAKFDAKGVCQWAIPVTDATAAPGITAVAIDPKTGDIAFSASFQGTVQVGSGTSKTTAGQNDILIVKLASNGTEKYVKAYGGPNDDRALDLVMDGTGRVIFGGSIVRTGATDISFDGKLSDPSMTTAQQGYIVQLDTGGTAQWARSFPTTGANSLSVVNTITFDLDGNFEIGGQFQETMRYNSGQLPAKNLVSAGIRSGFVAKCDGTTSYSAWANQLSAATSANVTAITSDPSRNVIAAFDYTGAITLGARNLTVFGMEDIAYVRYDSGGTVLDSHEFGTANKEEVYDIKADPWGEIVMIGTESSTINFGISATSHGGADGFLVKFDPKANALWAYGLGGTSDELFGFVDINSSGTIAFGGGSMVGNGTIAGKQITFDGGPYNSAVYGVLTP
jgi:hypothetical protein